MLRCPFQDLIQFNILNLCPFSFSWPADGRREGEDANEVGECGDRRRELKAHVLMFCAFWTHVHLAACCWALN